MSNKNDKWKDVELVQTCGAFPEQYNAYYNGEKIGYLRIRHGYFYAEYKEKRVYQVDTIGDGFFADEERDLQLNNAKKAIYSEMVKNK